MSFAQAANVPSRDGGIHQRLMELNKLAQDARQVMRRIESAMGTDLNDKDDPGKLGEVPRTTVDALIGDLNRALQNLLERLTRHEQSF